MTAQKVSLVCRGRSPTEDIILCLSRFALFCLSFGTDSLCTLHDCMSQPYLRFLSRERKIHPCNLENLTQGLEPEGDCRKSDRHLASPQSQCMSREGNELQVNLCAQPPCISISISMFCCYLLKDINNSR